MFEVVSGVVRDALKWVAIAQSDDAMRYFMNYIEVRSDNGSRFLTATDGHRLHSVELRNDAMSDCLPPDGSYKLIKQGAGKKALMFLQDGGANAGQFPKWRKLVYADDAATAPDSERFIDSGLVLSASKRHGSGMVYAKLYSIAVLNPEYIDGAMEADHEFGVLWHGVREANGFTSRAILLTSNPGIDIVYRALIMPMSIDSDDGSFKAVERTVFTETEALAA
jgi:hypothetical protein